MTFGEALSRAMDRKGIHAADLARQVGSTATTPWRWIHDVSFPTIQYADKLADLLDAPELRRMAVSALSKRCARSSCKRTFLATSRHRKDRKFCSPSCQMALTKKRFESKVRKGRRATFELLEKSVAAYCRSCEPEGLCRISDCPLRAVSPLPLVPRRAA